MTNERDYLRSVVEQIHADTHAALSATEARVSPAVQETPEGGLPSYFNILYANAKTFEWPPAEARSESPEPPVVTCDTCGGEGVPEARGNGYYHKVAADHRFLPPRPESPASETAEECECGHSFSPLDHWAPGMCARCLSGYCEARQEPPASEPEARPQEPRPTPSAEPVSPPPVEPTANNWSPLTLTDHPLGEAVEAGRWTDANGQQWNDCPCGGPVCLRRPVEAGVELPDPMETARAVMRAVDAVAANPTHTGRYEVLTALADHERAIASQAAAEAEARWERRVDQATRAAEHQFLELLEAREENARLRSKLEEAAGRFMGLASAMHYDTPLQAALIARAIETGVVLREHWRGYIERVCGEKETVANVVAATRRALEASASTEANGG